MFVFLLSFLVTLQQALSSGYINSVITTIEKRFEIPSSLSGLIASSYEIGNVITVIFVSYLGSRRHIPVWIAIGIILILLKNRPTIFIFLARFSYITITNLTIIARYCLILLACDLGAVIMGLGSMIFMVPHFTAEPYLTTTANHSNSDNICRGVSLREQDMGLGKYFYILVVFCELVKISINFYVIKVDIYIYTSYIFFYEHTSHY